MSLSQMKKENFSKFFSTSSPLARFKLAHTILMFWEEANTLVKPLGILLRLWPRPRQEDSWESCSASQGLSLLKGETSKERASPFLKYQRQPNFFCTQAVLRKSPHLCWATSVILEINEGFVSVKHVWLPWSKCALLDLSFTVLLIHLKFSSHSSSKIQLVMPSPQSPED